MEKNDKIRHRLVIPYLGLKGKTPKQVYQDMEPTLGEDTLLNRIVKKWPGKFKHGRERALKTTPVHEDHTMPDFVSFSIFKSRWLETANWLCLIICNRKTRNSYSFKFSVFSLIGYICTHANLQLYWTSASTLDCKLIEHSSYTVDL